MNIIILSQSRGELGGVERFSHYLQRALLKGAHKVTIVGIEDLSKGLRLVVTFSKFIAMSQPVLGFFLGRLAQKSDADIVITNGMIGWNVVKKITVNIQHGTFALSGLRIDKGRNTIKYLVKMHAWGFFEGLAARRSRVCVAMSSDTQAAVKKYYRASHCIKVYQAIDTNFFTIDGSQEKKYGGIFVGRFEYAKGKGVLEKIIEYMKQNKKQFLVAETLSQAELVRAYNQSEVLFFPSLQEGGPYVVLEAMACGIPFFMNPVGLGVDFLDNDFLKQFIMSSPDPNSYISAYEAYTKKINPERVAISKHLRDYVTQVHGFDLFEKNYQDIINSLNVDTIR